MSANFDKTYLSYYFSIPCESHLSRLQYSTCNIRSSDYVAGKVFLAKVSQCFIDSFIQQIFGISLWNQACAGH